MKLVLLYIIWVIICILLLHLTKKILGKASSIVPVVINKCIVKKDCNFLQLLLYEYEVQKSNFIKNIDTCKNTTDFAKQKNEFIISIKNYGFYIVKQSQINASNKWEMFTLCTVQMILTLSLDLVKDISIIDFIVGTIALWGYSYISLNIHPINKTSFVFKVGTIVEEEINKIDLVNSNINFDINLFYIDEEILRNNINDYFSALKKIQIEENEYYKKGNFILIDIFNIDDVVLKEKYFLTPQEISSYNKIREYRNEYFKRNFLSE